MSETNQGKKKDVKTKSPKESKKRSERLSKKKLSKEPVLGRTKSGLHSQRLISKRKKRTSKRDKTEGEAYNQYYENDVLAVRCDEKPYFWLCSVDKNTSTEDKQIDITWYEQINDNTYKEGAEDVVDPSTVICTTKLIEGSEEENILPLSELRLIQEILKLEKNEEQLDDYSSQASDDYEEKQGISILKNKKAKKSDKRTNSTKKSKRTSRKGTKKTSRKRKAEDTKDQRTTKRRRIMKRKEGEEVSGIELIEKDPTWTSESNSIAHIEDSYLASKDLIRSVLTNNMTLLKAIFADTKHVASLYVNRSVDVPFCALEYAVKNNNLDMIKAFIEYDKSKNEPRCSFPIVQLPQLDTGKINRYAFSHRVRKVSLSRGGKEGNNAFIKDLVYGRYSVEPFTCDSLESIITRTETISKECFLLLVTSYEGFKETCGQWIGEACQKGNRQVATLLLEYADEQSFNFLHKESLTYDDKDMSPFKMVSVRKRPYSNHRITPLHMACINPNVKYLKTLLEAVPDYDIADDTNRKLIHYAAACSSPAPLRYILTKSAARYKEPDRNGVTPLMIAADVGRLENVKLLCQHDKAENEDMEEEDDNEDENKTPRRGKRPITKTSMLDMRDNPKIKGEGWAAIHYAATSDHANIVKYLIKKGADKELACTGTKYSPLHIAAIYGKLRVVKTLVKKKVNIEQRDNKKKTPLIHAVINGHLTVVSYLIYMGADPNTTDSSMNSAVHYACAYGWYEILKYLVTGVDALPNTFNDWKTTPLSIALLKGHITCANYLLDKADVDVNIKDDEGKTLLSQLVSVPLTDVIVEQIKFLIEKKEADVTCTDVNGYSVLHHLAVNAAITPVMNSLNFPINLYETLMTTLDKLGIQFPDKKKKRDKNSEDEMQVDLEISAELQDVHPIKNDKKSTEEDDSECSNSEDSDSYKDYKFTPAPIEDKSKYDILIAKLLLKYNVDINLRTTKEDDKDEEDKYEKKMKKEKDSDEDDEDDEDNEEEDEAIHTKKAKKIEMKGKSPLQLAISRGAWELAQFFLENDADITMDKDGENILFDLIENAMSCDSSMKVFHTVCVHKDFPTLLNGVDNEGYTPLLRLLKMMSNIEIPELPNTYLKYVDRVQKDEVQINRALEDKIVNSLSTMLNIFTNASQDIDFSQTIQKQLKWRKISKEDIEKSGIILPGFVGKTPILMADGTVKPIKDIKEGDTIKSYNGSTGEITEESVFSITSNTRNATTVYTFDNGEVLEGTHTVTFYVVNKGWSSKGKRKILNSKKLEINDVLLKIYDNPNAEWGEMQKPKLIKMEKKVYESPQPIFCLKKVANNHTFFAYGLLVHNARTRQTARRSVFKPIKQVNEDEIKIPSEKKQYPSYGKCNIYHLLSKIKNTILLQKSLGLLQRANKDMLNAQDLYGNTPLHYAINDRCVSVAIELIKAGSSVQIPNEKGWTPLMRACEVSWNDLQEFLDVALSTKPDLNLCNKEKSTPLHIALTNNSNPYLVVSKLLEHRANPNVKDIKGKTPLHIAASKRMSKIVQLLIEKGASVKEKDNILCTPLHYALNSAVSSISAPFSLEESLIGAGANVNDQDLDGRTPLHYAFIKIGESPTLSTKIDPIDSVAGLCNVNGVKIDITDKYGMTPLHYAAQRGSTISTFYLLDHKANLEATNVDGNTPLGVALKYGHSDYSTILIQHKANLSNPLYFVEKNFDLTLDENNFVINRKLSVKSFKWTMFRQVVERQWQGVAHLMLKKVDFSAAMADALDAGQIQLMSTLLTSVKDNKIICKSSENGQTLLHSLSLFTNNIKENSEWVINIAEKLIKCGVDINTISKEGYHAIHFASRNQNYELLKFLIQNKVNPNIKDKKGRTPIVHIMKGFIATHFNNNNNNNNNKNIKNIKNNKNNKNIKKIKNIKNKNKKVVKNISNPNQLLDSDIVEPFTNAVQFLVNSGADPNVSFSSKRSEPLLIRAVIQDMHHIIEEVFLKPGSKVNINACDEKGYTALIQAITTKKLSLVRKLIEFGADPNTPDHDGLTPLMRALKINDMNLVAALKSSSTPINYNAKDYEGKTVIHHIVNPLPFGSYENVKLLNEMAKSGADVNIPDNYGHPPLYYSLMQDTGVITNALSKLGAKPILARPMRELSILPTNQWPDSGIDLDADLESYLQSFGKAKRIRTVPKVDMYLDLKNTEVLSKDSIIYDVFMSKTDVTRSRWGNYNFYVMQVVHEKVKDLYILFNRWGRMGSKGQFQRTPFNKMDDAIAEFEKIFKTKTGNIWSKKMKFEKKPKKWHLVAIDRVKRDYSKIQLKPWKFDECPDSNLPPQLQKTLMKLTDISTFQSSMRESGLDTELLPLSTLSQYTLDRALSILNSASDTLKKIKEEQSNTATKLDFVKLQKWYQEISEFSNEFYELIPHADYSRTTIPTLDDESVLQEKQEMIHNLCDINIGRKILMAASHASQTMNPLDYCLKALEIKLDVLRREDDEFKTIELYTKNTSRNSNYFVKNVYRIQRRGEAERIAKWKDIPNHLLLWHGSHASNFIGILSEGLRISPSSARISGHAFGKGIYFADMIAKSIHYCRSSKTAFLLLSEVALGKMKLIRKWYDMDDDIEGLPTGYNSVKAVGRYSPDFENSLVLPNGVRIPQEIATEIKLKHYITEHNEYVVYDPTQVRIRYLVEVIM